MASVQGTECGLRLLARLVCSFLVEQNCGVVHGQRETHSHWWVPQERSGDVLVVLSPWQREERTWAMYKERSI